MPSRRPSNLLLHRRPGSELACRLRVFALLLGLSCLFVRPARATPVGVVIELDAAAERVVDPRSTRRLVPLELSDVGLSQVGGAHPAAVLFFRVLGREDDHLRVELWERGEFHGARTLNGAGENPQLVARRVALAAAELGRRLARKRQAVLARDERARRSRLLRELEERERVQDGPVALRSELALATVPGKLRVFGQSLAGELSLRGRLRLDVALEQWGGSLSPQLRAQLHAVSLGPGFRWALSPGVDFDLGLSVAALLVRVPAANRLDDVPDQDASWTARVSGSTRLELRLSRQARLLLGVQGGALVRSLHYLSAVQEQRLRGTWWAGSLGVVITPRL